MTKQSQEIKKVGKLPENMFTKQMLGHQKGRNTECKSVADIKVRSEAYKTQGFLLLICGQNKARDIK